jgi:hypothetical protein
MRASARHCVLPAIPDADDPARVENAPEFAGTYSAGERALQVIAEGERLFVMHEGARVPLERLPEADRFVARHPALDRFAFVFGRKKADAPDSAVVEVSWGGDWYGNAKYQGPDKFEYPKAWDAFVGHYRNENPWVGSMRIVVNKGRLMVDGTIPLEADGEPIHRQIREGNHAGHRDSTDWRDPPKPQQRIRLSGSDLQGGGPPRVS